MPQPGEVWLADIPFTNGTASETAHPRFGALKTIHAIVAQSISRTHVDTDHAGRDAGQLVAGLVIDNAQKLVRAGNRQVIRPLGGGALEISVRGEHLDLAGIVAQRLAVQPENAEDDFADLIGLVGRERQVTGHLRAAGLFPGGVAMDGRQHRPARGPIFRLKFFDELNPPEIRRLLDRKRAAIDKRPVHAARAVAVTGFGIERDDGVERAGLKLGKFAQGSLNSTSMPFRVRLAPTSTPIFLMASR